jgi:hypothetical protein
LERKDKLQTTVYTTSILGREDSFRGREDKPSTPLSDDLEDIISNTWSQSDSGDTHFIHTLGLL